MYYLTADCHSLVTGMHISRALLHFMITCHYTGNHEWSHAMSSSVAVLPICMRDQRGLGGGAACMTMHTRIHGSSAAVLKNKAGISYDVLTNEHVHA